MPIRRLPLLLVNQIAAGEVIERPASVVKELVENAIDAGASRVDVAIEKGGRELVRVSDNGSGIPPEELELAIAPHATSKIETGADLDAIATMGFRGEALASIGSVSRTTILSRTRAFDAASRLDAEGERVGDVRPEAGPVGTSVTVRNLFFNTPARRKFLKTDPTETGRCGEVVRNLALSHPSLGFTLTVDGRRTIDLPPGQAPRERILDVLGRELEPQLLDVDFTEHGVTVRGLAGTPEIARGTGRHQRLFLNGRHIADRSVLHAIKEAYRGLIDPGRHPTVVLFLLVDPATVDVNVHPAKAEVRFRDQSAVHAAVRHALRAVLAAADLTPAVEVRDGRPSGPAPTFGSGLGRAPSGPWPGPSGPRRPGGSAFPYHEAKDALAGTHPAELERTIREEPGALPPVRAATNALQVHASYIVTEDEEGIVIIDQHALHERVMFEKLKARMATERLEAQRLLLPAVVEADRAQIEAFEELRPMLDRLGIEAELMGRASIAVHAFTSLLFERNVDPVSFMQDLLARAADDGLPAEPEAALHEVLDMMARKAAIKAGERLGPEAMAELLRFRADTDRASNCPHGRPTTLRLSLRELERQFGRR